MKKIQLLFGHICEVDSSSGLARVQFDEDNLASPLLSYAQAFTKDAKIYAPPTIGEQVAVLMDASGTSGVILGALYSETDTAGADDDTFKIELPGMSVVYNSGTSMFEISTGALRMQLDAAGNSITLGSQTDSLGSILSDLIDATLAETHISAAAGSPTSTPVNFAQYQAIKARLNLLFL